MTDIVTRLRNMDAWLKANADAPVDGLYSEAADEIERLWAKCDRAARALDAVQRWVNRGMRLAEAPALNRKIDAIYGDRA